MANQDTSTARRLRRCRWLMPTLLLASVGCGFPHDRYASDPLLGNFLRPIAATPPIWTGGDPGVSPAYDGGARMGLPSPDVPAFSSDLLDRMFLMPTYSGSVGSGSMFRGNSSSILGPLGSNKPAGNKKTTGENKPVRKTIAPAAVGAHLMSPAVDRSPTGAAVSALSAPAPSSPSPSSPSSPSAAAPPRPSTSSVMPRPLDTNTLLTSGAAIESTFTPSKPLSPTAAMKDPRAVYSVDEAQAILQTCGAKSMAMEPQPTGEWRFICTMNDGAELHRYEAKATEPIEAVRAVLWQVKNAQ